MPFKDPEKKRLWEREYRIKHREEINAYCRAKRKENPEYYNAICKRYRERHPEKRKESANKWARKNREKTQARFVEKYNNNIQFNCAIKFRRRIYMAIRKQYTSKSFSTIELLGCSYDELKSYLESKFTEGMTWEKLLDGKIHLDHIVPCSSFDLSKPDEQKKCFHYTNLQPLWAKDNLSKSNKLDWSHD